ncbi:MAG: exo-alpha-sialidase [Cyclobacteriaceae bacterium]|nr:exo-alpha-sialidase [Cyclobacteriaceae bacterium HetDA_MAG_MS6]
MMMRKYLARYIVLLTAFGLFWACGTDDEPTPPPPTEEPDEDTTQWVIESTIPGNPIGHIEWGSPRKVSHEVYGADYPRMISLGGDTLFLTYHGGPQNNDWDNLYLRKSFDRGQTWLDAEVLMADDDPDYYGFANPQLLALRSGRILLAFTGRGNPDDNQHNNIQVMHSDDRGMTWSRPRVVAYGRSWEPGLVEHPGGDVLMFYSSEARWWQVSDQIEQEILMTRSETNGISWSSPRSVAYTAGMRDGMPVPIVLRDGKGLVFAIESVGNRDSPWMLHSSLSNRFESANQVERYLAAPKSLVNFGGGPFIIQLPTGETILSCHDTGGRNIGSDWKKNTMYVLIGDSDAQNFSNVSYPFPDLPPDEGAFFNAVHALDANTVIALGSRHFADGHAEVHWVTGSIIREQ